MTRPPLPPRRGALAAAAALALALPLAGCISLLPKSEPAQLYRFGQTPPAAADAEGPAAAAASAAAAPVGVFFANSQFPQEAAGDRILTLANGKAAYIADTRWVAPAAVLWRQAVAEAFEADPGPTRLISRGETAKADYILRLDVRTFETRYERGPKGAPTVVVRVRGLLTRGAGANPAQAAERLFEQRVDAADNRVTAIVPAYDKAVAGVLGEVVDWANATATGA